MMGPAQAASGSGGTGIPACHAGHGPATDKNVCATIKQALFRPIVAPLILHRPSAAAIGIASAAQVLATALHLPGIDCPLLRVVGIPCPGCGLSRACAAMLKGDPHHSLHMHAFAVPVLIGVALLLIAAILRTSARERLGRAVERVELKTGFTFLLLAALLLYWLGRLLYAPHEFISLIGHR